MEEKRKYTITDYLMEKTKMQDEIDSIIDEIEELEERKYRKIEEYTTFCEDYLRRNSLEIKTWEEEE